MKETIEREELVRLRMIERRAKAIFGYCSPEEITRDVAIALNVENDDWKRMEGIIHAVGYQHQYDANSKLFRAVFELKQILFDELPQNVTAWPIR